MDDPWNTVLYSYLMHLTTKNAFSKVLWDEQCAQMADNMVLTYNLSSRAKIGTLGEGGGRGGIWIQRKSRGKTEEEIWAVKQKKGITPKKHKTLFLQRT